MRLPDLLRIRGFRDLWLGQAISQLGDSLYYVAFMFMAEKLTGSLAIVGYVGAMETLPFLLFGAHSGVIADRFDRRKIMLFSDIACGGTLLLYALYVALVGTPAIWTLLLVPFLLSSVRVFFMPAKSASIPMLVPQKQLLAANSLSAATFNVMFMMGLAFSATVVAKLYGMAPALFFGTILVMNGLSFLGSAVYIRRLPRLVPEREAGKMKPWEDFKSGLRFIAGRPDLKAYIALMTAFRFGVGPFFVVYVATNKEWFGGSPATLMWFEFAFFAGMILGSWWVSKVRVVRPGSFFSWSLALVGVTVAAMAFCQNWLWGFLLWNVLAGIAVPFADVPMITYLQSSVSDAFRGRVNSVREMISVGVMPISMVAAGSLVQFAGLSAAYLVMGGIMVFACLIGLLSASFRDAKMPVAQEYHITPEREAASVA